MKYAIYSPTIDLYADPNLLVELAKSAESAGWDGFFIWDHIAIMPEGKATVIDAMVTLSAIAAATEKIALGPMVTPICRRRPWKLAKELAALDQLSKGRVRFGVGLGAPEQEEFGNFGEEMDAKIRARKTDEALPLIEQLLNGDIVSHEGEFYRVSNTKMLPTKIQNPRIPCWVAAMLPFKAGQKRAARWDGILPQKLPVDMKPEEIKWSDMCLSPDEVKDVVSTVQELRKDLNGFDVIAFGSTQDSNISETQQLLKQYQAAGATWWFEWLDSAADSNEKVEKIHEHIRRGPQRVS